MEFEKADDLNLEIVACQVRLNHVVSQLSTGMGTPSLLEEGIMTAHSLKTMSAVKGNARLQAAAAQLEQLLRFGQGMPMQEWSLRFEADLKALGKDLSLQGIPENAIGKDTPARRRLTRLVESVRQMDMKQREKSLKLKSKQQIPPQVGLESLIKTFIPWLTQAAQTQGKLVNVNLSIQPQLSLPAHQTGPLQTILVQLLRNSVFHGIEPPVIRQNINKPREGVIEVKLTQDADGITLVVSDDGKGFNQPAASRSRSLPLTDVFVSQSQDEETEAGSVDTSMYAVQGNPSGLGIGLHIVKTQVEKLGGSLEMKSIPSLGTSVIVRLPLATLRYAEDASAE